MTKVGLVGWRGMVGSVLMQRMVEEGDFAHIDPVYFSTSAAGGKAPMFGVGGGGGGGAVGLSAIGLKRYRSRPTPTQEPRHQGHMRRT